MMHPYDWKGDLGEAGDGKGPGKSSSPKSKFLFDWLGVFVDKNHFVLNLVLSLSFGFLTFWSELAFWSFCSNIVAQYSVLAWLSTSQKHISRKPSRYIKLIEQEKDKNKK